MKEHSQRQKKIKVLMVGPYPPPYGGIAVMIRDILTSPLAEEFTIYLLRTTPPQKMFDALYRFILDVSRLVSSLIRIRPHIVHIHTSYDWGWPKHITYAIISKIFRKKVVLHHHGIPNNSNYARGGKIKYIYPPQLALMLVDHIIAISPKIGEIISNVVGERKVDVIPNSVSNDIINVGLRRDLRELSERVNILFLGRLIERKGIKEFLYAIYKLGSVYQGIHLRYYIVGHGALDEYVSKFIKNNGLEKFVCLKFNVSENEKIKILKESDIFVLPSEHEGLPISILEAMGAGLFIITSPVGGIPDVIKDYENGLLIKPRDSEEIIKAIKWCLEHPKEVKKIRNKNVREVLEKYSWERNVKKIGKIYLNLVKKSNTEMRAF